MNSNVPLSTIKVLAEKGYLDPDDEIVCGVTAQVFIDFVESMIQKTGLSLVMLHRRQDRAGA